jgi:fluoride exporter
VIWVAVGLASAIGSLARFGTARVTSPLTERLRLPAGTLAVNVIGSFVLGVITGLALWHGLSATTRTALGTGFCGGYTTFSAVTVETIELAERDRKRAGVNLLVELALPTAAAALGLFVTSR